MNPVTRYLRTLVFGFLSLVLLFTLGCGTQTPAQTGTSIEITDQLGRTVSLDRVPQRIISLGPANTEIVYALGLADRLVGVTDFCNYPAEAKQKQSIGGFSTPNLEKVIALAPDIVLAAPIHQKQIIPQLEEKGIKVLALAPRTLDEVRAAITMAGKVMGVEKKASDVVAGMDRRIKAVTDKTANLAADKRPKVLYIVWHDPLMGSGLETFHDELIKKAGGVNMVGDLKGYPRISSELVIEANPAVIITGVGHGEGSDAPLKFAQNEPTWREISARRTNRIHGIDSDIASRAGPRIVDALEIFAKLIHPELFK